MCQTGSVIAVLDDEPKMRKALHRLLMTHGFRVQDYARGNDLLAELPVHPADCLVLDLHMPEVSGFDVLSACTARHHTMPVVVITGHEEPDTAQRVMSLGASAYLTKPVDEAVLLFAIHTALERPAEPDLNLPASIKHHRDLP